MKFRILLPTAALINVSGIAIGYSSFGVALLRSLKSTQTHHRPSFFCTGTTLEIHLAYLHGLMNQSNSELPSSSPTRSLGLPHIQIDVQIAYDLCFGRSTYAWKAKEIKFQMALVSCPTRIGVVYNHQNSTNFQNHFWCCTTILVRWAV
jgi:hypothetical protein